MSDGGLNLPERIVESTDDAILSLTHDGVITTVNAGAERLYGYARSDLIGQPLSTLVPEGRWADDEVILKRVAGGEDVGHFETQRVRKDGKIVEVSVTLTPIRDKAGAVVGLASLARDIGEQKAHAEHIEELERIRSEFVAKVAHELRNPLATIRGFAGLMSDASKEMSAEERTRFSETIVRQCDHLAKLVDDVLQVSYMDAGDFSYAHIEYQPKTLLESAIEETRAAYPSHRITLNVTGTLPAMNGDPERLEQVLTNLLANACRYSTEGSTVSVRAGVANRSLEIDVQDQGPGIAEEDRHLLFRRFSRLPQRDRRVVKGTGLGLYISKGIVSAHGGDITVESEIDHGTTFRVSLPL